MDFPVILLIVTGVIAFTLGALAYYMWEKNKTSADPHSLRDELKDILATISDEIKELKARIK